MYYVIWNVLKNVPFVSTHQFNGVVKYKYKWLYTMEDKEKVKHGLKAKNIITTAFGVDEFLCVFH